MSRRQFSLLPPCARLPRLHRMHVADMGEGGRSIIALFECRRCHQKSDWVEIDGLTAARKGIPCPTCNKDLPS
jgi:hypothetical protein